MRATHNFYDAVGLRFESNFTNPRLFLLFLHFSLHKQSLCYSMIYLFFPA